MISDRPPGIRASALQGRAWALPLLVMAVLCGLLAMHGLGAAPAPESHSHEAMAHSAPETADAGGHAAHAHGEAHGAASRPGPQGQHADRCECDGTGGHVAHADAACSASGTSGSPSMDGAAFSTAAGPRPATELEGWCRPDTGTERAPPSLHRLQLLRI